MYNSNLRLMAAAGLVVIFLGTHIKDAAAKSVMGNTYIWTCDDSILTHFI